MKKRLIALLLCLVMLVTCMGVGIDVLTGDEDTAAPETTVEPSAEPSSTPEQDESDLFAQLMACETQEEMDALIDGVTEEEIAALLTEEQISAASEHYAALAPASEETAEESGEPAYIPAVNFTNVAPMLDPVKGAAPRKLARAAANGSGKDEGVVYNKTATANGNGTYTITLEAYATGEKVISQISKDVPTDIVLVLDQSGSMAFCMQCGKENCNGHMVGKEPIYANEVNTNDFYYAYIDGECVKMRYCPNNHSASLNKHENSWVKFDLVTSGWYHKNFIEKQGTIFPMTSESDTTVGHVQFYRAAEKVEETRLQALTTAVTQFTNAVAEKAAGKDGNITTTADNINHRIAIVGFASKSGNGNNTELLSIKDNNSGEVGVKYGAITEQNYKDVLQSMDTAAGKTMVSNAIKALAAEGATRTDLGMDMAERILSANPVKQGELRNRVVVVFTDGSPTNSNGFQKTVANSAITTSERIQDSGATVYTIGVFSGANANEAGQEPSKDLENDFWGNPAYTDKEMTDACNWFMQKLSSNKGKVSNPSFYLSAGDSASLNNIFKQISDQIETGGATTTLDSKTVIKDVVSDAFKLPNGATGKDITLETYKYVGENKWTKNPDAMGATASVNTATGEVSVTGFDFKENYVADIKNDAGAVTGHRGHKLVIKFNVTAKDGFLGGNGVPTNANAGIYANKDADKPIFTFNKPTVNVPIKDVTVAAADKNVYLMSDLTAEELKNGATVKAGNVSLKLNDNNFGLKSWQNEYVNITPVIKDKDGKTVTSLYDLKVDQDYSLTVTVSPKTGSGEKSGTGTAKVNVFTPVLTYQDSAIDLGTTPNYGTENYVSTAWNHKGTDSETVTMVGTAPTLTLSYDPAAGAFSVDTHVKVTVKIGGTDVTGNVKFEHETCTYEPCNFDKSQGQFVVHIKTFDLTITKRITSDESDLYGARDFVFNVKSEDGKTDIDVVVHVDANSTSGSTTIKGLPVGTYTITENHAWSWRYELEGVARASETNGELRYTDGYSATYTPKDGTNNGLVFTNRLVEFKWLSFVDRVQNIFGSK